MYIVQYVRLSAVGKLEQSKGVTSGGRARG